jgi:hypothetical protein
MFPSESASGTAGGALSKIMTAISSTSDAYNGFGAFTVMTYLGREPGDVARSGDAPAEFTFHPVSPAGRLYFVRMRAASLAK